MSAVGDAKSQVMGYLSAIRTMLDNYPQPKLSHELESLLNTNTPFGVILSFLRVCGVSNDKLLNWVAKLLCGKEVIVSQYSPTVTDDYDEFDQGFLDVIEETMKVLLLTNVKNMFTCSINPIIPDSVLKTPSGVEVDNLKNGNGIKIPLSTIDLYNTLSFTPTDKKGLGYSLYFDNNYNSIDIWKSTDFNAFLWYTIHRGGDERKRMWDNRVRKRKQLKTNATFSKNFFNLECGDGSFIPLRDDYNVGNGTYPNRPSGKEKRGERKNKDSVEKKQYIIVEYNERDDTSITMPDCLTIWLNADRYSFGKVNLNKTVFEFNFDYIHSLKLFDSKTIVSNIINSLLGISFSTGGTLLGAKYSLQQQVIAGQVSKIVKELINGEETTINDCFFSFSNEEYEALLNDAELKQFNDYKFGESTGSLSDEDIADISNTINNIGSASTLEEVQTNITNVFTKVASVVPARSEEIEMTDSFTFGTNIIMKIIEESVVQIVMQMLSPKVMLLFALNSYFMGDVTDNDFSKISVSTFIKGLSNLIVASTRQVFELLLKEFVQFLLDQIRPLIILMLEKLLRERLQFFIDLLKRLLALIQMFAGTMLVQRPTSIIDNVNYADIIPKQEKPSTSTC